MTDHDTEALLDIISADTFDNVADQLIERMNASRDASTLYRLLDVVYERAIDAAEAPDMYARLLRRMMDRVSPHIHDASVKSVNKTPLAAGRLFLRYVLSLVQEDFERITAKAWADDDGMDQVEAIGSSSKPRISRNRGLNIVKLIGGLFKMHMLTERVVHGCIQRLLPDTDNPQREDIERVCSLLIAVSKRLDSTRANLQMNVYYSHIDEISRSPKVDGHMRSLLLRVVALRSNSKLLSSDVPEVQPSFRAQNERTTNTARGGLQSLRGRVTDRVPRGSIVQLSVCVESEGDLRPETESVAEPLPEGFNTLERVDDTWTPISQQRQLNEDDDSPARVDRKVKSLLNKLTMEKFDSISDRIIAWANRSRSEKDARTLIQVTRTVFDKAVDNAAHSEVYARLCRKMMEQISPDVQDESIKGSEGKPIAGGQLFRKYLLDRCHEGFERGWAPREAVVAAAKAKAGDDAAVLAANADKMEDKIALYSDEYYAEQKAKQRGLGLVKFIGELFKLQMLTERPMHECVKKLLGNVDNPEEEDIESLCVLLSTVGKLLDTQRASPYMDIYFARMRELSKNPKVSSRMQYMLLEVNELRERKWIPRNAATAPVTIAQIREDAAKESLRAANERTISMSRGGSWQGGWMFTGSPAATQRQVPPKAGDLSQFGKIATPAAGPMTFGPSSVFSKKEGKRETASMSRASSMNAFSILSHGGEAPLEAAGPALGKNSRAPSRKPSVDLGPGGAPEGLPARRKLNLLPRSKAAEEPTTPDAEGAVAFPSTEGDAEAEAADGGMSEADANKRIDEDLKEFFAIRNVDEGEDYFEKLPAAHHARLVEKVVSRAIESKEADAQLAADLFARAVEKELCTPDAFERGFLPIAELLDDIAIDAPKAFNLMALMLKGAGLADDEERRGRIAEKSIDADKLIALLS